MSMWRFQMVMFSDDLFRSVDQRLDTLIIKNGGLCTAKNSVTQTVLMRIFIKCTLQGEV